MWKADFGESLWIKPPAWATAGAIAETQRKHRKNVCNSRISPMPWYPSVESEMIRKWEWMIKWLTSEILEAFLWMINKALNQMFGIWFCKEMKLNVYRCDKDVKLEKYFILGEDSSWTSKYISLGNL